MSRRRLLHGKACSIKKMIGRKRGLKDEYVVVRGSNAEIAQWRADHGIRPRGLRKKDPRHQPDGTE